MFIALLIIVGAVVAMFVVRNLIGKATSAAERAVFHKARQAGRTEMARTLSFTAPTSPLETVEAIVSSVNPHPSAPAVAGGLYLAQRSDNLIVFAVGNKMNTAMRARVDVRPADAGTAGTFQVIDWKESGARVLGNQSVDRMIDRITAAINALSGTVAEGSLH